MIGQNHVKLVKLRALSKIMPVFLEGKLHSGQVGF